MQFQLHVNYFLYTLSFIDLTNITYERNKRQVWMLILSINFFIFNFLILFLIFKSIDYKVVRKSFFFLTYKVVRDSYIQ